MIEGKRSAPKIQESKKKTKQKKKTGFGKMSLVEQLLPNLPFRYI